MGCDPFPGVAYQEAMDLGGHSNFKQGKLTPLKRFSNCHVLYCEQLMKTEPNLISTMNHRYKLKLYRISLSNLKSFSAWTFKTVVEVGSQLSHLWFHRNLHGRVFRWPLHSPNPHQLASSLFRIQHSPALFRPLLSPASHSKFPQLILSGANSLSPTIFIQ